MISVYVLSESAIVGQDLKDSLVISIVSPGREHPYIQGTNIHKFHFHDVIQVYEMPDGMLVRPMSETIAEQIVDVALKNIHVEKWFIHCEAGISRSPGVAIGLSKYFSMSPNRKTLQKMFQCHNKHVRKLIEEELQNRMEK